MSKRDEYVICKNCDFYVQSTKPDEGHCRKHAPTHLSGACLGVERNLFPFVHPLDWCGDWHNLERIDKLIKARGGTKT